MALILSDLGARAILKAYFQGIFEANPHTLQLRLFVNEHEPVDGDLAADYTEAAGGGYAPLELLLANFVLDIFNGIEFVRYPEYQFIFSGPLDDAATVKGYFVTDGAGVVIFAEKKPNAYEPVNDGDALAIALAFQLSKGTPA